ncbi:MAG: DUF4430 domain-containing protein, partial [Syntrophomonadaceae bacterium]|nr:DUF4430 domain-containing protein [Syntrophomonadaceae bacterium]
MTGRDFIKKILSSVSIILLLMFLAAGCGGYSLLRNHPDSSPNASKEEQASQVKKQAVDLLVTRDFGAQTIFAQRVPYKEDATILDVMQAHLQVETAYGGSFINVINGLASNSGEGGKDRQDWFYYVNGIACDVGVLDYNLKDAGSVWWDYH